MIKFLVFSVGTWVLIVKGNKAKLIKWRTQVKAMLWALGLNQEQQFCWALLYEGLSVSCALLHRIKPMDRLFYFTLFFNKYCMQNHPQQGAG